MRALVATPFITAILALGAGTWSTSAVGPSAPAGKVKPTVRSTPLRAPGGSQVVAPGSAVGVGELQAIAFSSATAGFALAQLDGETYPVRTLDGGRSFLVAGPPLDRIAGTGPDAVGDLVAPSALEAVAYGGPASGSTIDVTTNSGRTWRRTHLGAGVLAVSGASGTLWALVALDHGPGSPVSLYVSSDKGASWTYRSILTGVAGSAAVLQRFGTTTAVALVSGPRGEASGTSGLLETTNSGRTWQERRDPCAASVLKAGADFTELLTASSPSALLMACGTEPATGMEQKVVEASSNGGRTWKLESRTKSAKRAGTAIPLYDWLGDPGTTGIFLTTSSRSALLVLSGNGSLWATADAGATWHLALSSRIEDQFPVNISIARGAVFVETMDALWRGLRGGPFELMEGSRKPY